MCMPIDRLGLFRMVKISHSNRGHRKKIDHTQQFHGLWYVLSKFDLKCVSAAYESVSFDPGYQLLNCLDCIESDSLLLTRIEKIFATSQGMFRYKEIVYVVIIFLEHSSQIMKAS
jgi:hypothetical protein